MISVRHLYVKAQKKPLSEAVRDCQFELTDSSTLSLVRGDGGPVAVLRVIAGALKPTEGTVYSDHAKELTVRIPSEPCFGLAKGATVRKLLLASARGSCPLLLKKRRGGASADVAARRAEEAARLFGLGAVLERKIGELSAAEAFRAAYGVALVAAPTLILSEEPFAREGEEIAAFLAEQSERIRVATLIATSNAACAAACGATLELQ